jgi:hypothetical protein
MIRINREARSILKASKIEGRLPISGQLGQLEAVEGKVIFLRFPPQAHRHRISHLESYFTMT